MRYSTILISGLLGIVAVSSCKSGEETMFLQEGESVVLRANYGGEQETKTSFGTSTSTGSYAEIQWNEGDAVNLFYKPRSSGSYENAHLVTENSGKTAVFSLSDEDTDLSAEIKSAADFYGLYPYDGEAEISSSVIKARIPSFQEAVPDSFDPSAFIAVGHSNAIELGASAINMAFYNVCGGISFTLENPEKYTAIELYGNSGEPVSGDIEISLSDAENPAARPAGANQTKITLAPADGESFRAGERYYISLLPGDFHSGFTMVFLGADGRIVETCVCTASVSFRRSAFAYVENADNPGKLAGIRDGVLLSSGDETANCYVVSAPGTYKFPLVRGLNPEAILTEASEVDVLWETANTAKAPSRGSIISDVTINKNQVYFKVPDPMKDGNALIAARSGDGEILWSWHIWVCEGYDPETSSERLDGKPKDMLDRNLGALAASAGDPLSNGLFYQWGRKDPFPGAVERYVESSTGGTFFATTKGSFDLKAAEVSVNVAYAIAHPDEYITSSNGHWLTVEDDTLWGDVKSDYDPCPTGWKVPSCYSYTAAGGHDYEKEAWNGVGYTRYQDAASGYGAYFDLSGSGRSWYPNTGYISTAGKLLMVGQYSIYWSCNPMGGNVYGLELSQNMRGQITLNPWQGGKYRGEGHTVRCIRDI